MLRGLLLTACLAVAAPAVTAPALAAPHMGRTQCVTLEAMIGRLDNLRANHVVYEGDAVQRAERIYAATPPISTKLGADHLIMADLPNGAMALMFVRGTDICATMLISDTKIAEKAKTFIIGQDV